MELERAEIDESGLRGDRLLFLIDENGDALGQDDLPRMALIKPSIIGADLVVAAPDRDSLELVVSDQGESRQTKHWEDEAPAIDQGDDAARWFSEYLDTPCRLMASTELHKRPVPEKYRHIFPAEQSRFTAVAPILLTSEASLSTESRRRGECSISRGVVGALADRRSRIRKGGVQRALRHHAVESGNCRAGYRADPHAREIPQATRGR
jgi:uncharacterized protein YcbX